MHNKILKNNRTKHHKEISNHNTFQQLSKPSNVAMQAQRLGMAMVKQVSMMVIWMGGLETVIKGSTTANNGNGRAM